MTRAQAERLCRRINEDGRNVHEHNFTVASAEHYWRRCTVDGNFLITGGDDVQRADMLVEKLALLRCESTAPVILLTCSDYTASAVIGAAEQNRLGRVKVSSPKYKNYHPLCGMEPEKIHTLLMKVADYLGCEKTNLLSNYVRAFIAIGSAYYPPTLASLMGLDESCPDAESLAGLGREAGVDAVHITAIDNYPAGSANVRDILEKLRSCYSNIGTDEADNPFSIVDGCNDNMLMCINVNSPEREIMDICLAEELAQLMGRGRRFHLIIDDVPLRSSDGLFAQLMNVKGISGNCVGICDGNVTARAANIPADRALESVLSNISQFVVFCTGRETDADLSQVLCTFGDYPYHEVQAGGGHGWFELTHHDNYTVVPVGERPRVRPRDMDGYGVAMAGHDLRTVHLYRKIKI